jgi:3-hydroxyacyl-[acyl-carrier-protein] dehydratase
MDNPVTEEYFSISCAELPEYISDRYPYLLIDRVDKVYPGKKAEGIKNLTWNEWFFPIHYKGDPCMPGYLIAEAITELCTIPILTEPGNKGKSVYLTGAKNMRLFRKATPGDCMKLEGEIISNRHNLISAKGSASIDGKTVCTIEMSFVLTDFKIEVK